MKTHNIELPGNVETESLGMIKKPCKNKYMKLNNDSGNVGLDALFTYNYGMNKNYGADEVREYLTFIDQIDIEIAEEMLAMGD